MGFRPVPLLGRSIAANESRRPSQFHSAFPVEISIPLTSMDVLVERWAHSSVNTEVKVHHTAEQKYIGLKVDRPGELVSGRGSARGISPLAAPERSDFAVVAEAVLAGCSRLIVTDAALAVFEPEAVAVHLEDVNVVSETIQQRAS